MFLHTQLSERKGRVRTVPLLFTNINAFHESSSCITLHPAVGTVRQLLNEKEDQVRADPDIQRATATQHERRQTRDGSHLRADRPVDCIHHDRSDAYC